MITFEQFSQDVHEALSHLYDPAARVPASLRFLAAERAALQAALLREIDELKPAADLPPENRIKRMYDVLSYRFVHGLTQDEAADRLGITPRYLRRRQQQAINLLARCLWQRAYPDRPLPMPAESAAVVEAERTDADAPNWQAQVHMEVQALQRKERTQVSDVSDVLHGVLQVVRTLAQKRGVAISVAAIPAQLQVSLPQPILRQILIDMAMTLLSGMTAGRVDMEAAREGKRVRISLRGTPASLQPQPQHQLATALLAPHNIIAEWRAVGDTVTCTMSAPALESLLESVNVLVVDDNLELVHCYQAYTAGSCYNIVPLADGADLFETARELRPQAIILDVMLPEIDGWELLTHLHEHPLTEAIPVIICSVMQQEELALALGAALYVPKPVRRQQFLAALDQVTRDAAGTA